jgi:hypothetical protein
LGREDAIVVKGVEEEVMVVEYNSGRRIRLEERCLEGIGSRKRIRKGVVGMP